MLLQGIQERIEEQQQESHKVLEHNKALNAENQLIKAKLVRQPAQWAEDVCIYEPKPDGLAIHSICMCAAQPAGTAAVWWCWKT